VDLTNEGLDRSKQIDVSSMVKVPLRA
jgi:hypothetical protein